MAETLPDLVLMSGPERVLAERAISDSLEAIRAQFPESEVLRVDAADYEPGRLSLELSPSLFGGHRIVIVRDLDEGSDALIDEVEDAVKAGLADAHLLVWHKGSNRGKRALDAMKKAKARVIDVPAMKTDKLKSEFVTAEFRRARRKATPDAVRALVEALGKDSAELASGCAQLIADTQGVIDEHVVETYYGGRVEATGFRVAEAAVAGNASEALRLLRHALSAGVDPVPMVALMASQLRQVAKVATAGSGPKHELAKSLGMAPWQIDRARSSARGWDGARLGQAIQAVAAADFDVKGGGRDPIYAVEHMLLTICRLRHAPSERH